MVTELTTGMGLRMLSEMDPAARLDAALTAVIVTGSELGMPAGGVYRPVEEMVPVEADPPVTKFTCQVTAWLLVSDTVAANCDVAPSLVWLGPVTVTTIVPGEEELEVVTGSSALAAP
jgi:hypothetical protein